MAEILPATEAGSGGVSHRYDLNGNEVLTVVSNGANTKAVVRTFDAMNRLTSERIRMADPAQNNVADLVTSNCYDAVGNLAAARDGNGNWTANRYDALLRKVQTILPPVPGTNGPASYSEGYAYAGHCGSGAFSIGGWTPSTVTNARGHVAKTDFDAAWRPTNAAQRASGGGDDATHPRAATQFSAGGLKIRETVYHEGDETRTTYLFYDHQRRLAATVVDMDGERLERVGPPPGSGCACRHTTSALCGSADPPREEGIRRATA